MKLRKLKVISFIPIIQFGIWIYWIYVYTSYGIDKRQFFKQIIKFFAIELILQIISVLFQKYIISNSVIRLVFSTLIFCIIGQLMIKDINSIFSNQEKEDNTTR